MLHSDKIPDVPTNISTLEMTDLFQNFALNWSTLSSVLFLLFGTLFGFYVLKRVKQTFY